MKKHITLDLMMDVWEKAKEMAKATDRTFTGLIHNLIRKEYINYQRKNNESDNATSNIDE